MSRQGKTNLTEDTRKAILDALAHGGASQSAIAERFHVSVSTVSRIKHAANRPATSFRPDVVFENPDDVNRPGRIDDEDSASCAVCGFTLPIDGWFDVDGLTVTPHGFTYCPGCGAIVTAYTVTE